MIRDTENITQLVKMCDEDNLIEVLFKEEIIHAIRTPILVAHLLESMGATKLLAEAIEYKKMTRSEIKEMVAEITATYIE